MLRELEQRTCNGLTVTLEWDSETGRLQVRCEAGIPPPVRLRVMPMTFYRVLAREGLATLSCPDRRRHEL
jgi:hypothetical protein